LDSPEVEGVPSSSSRGSLGRAAARAISISSEYCSHEAGRSFLAENKSKRTALIFFSNGPKPVFIS